MAYPLKLCSINHSQIHNPLDPSSIFQSSRTRSPLQMRHLFQQLYWYRYVKINYSSSENFSGSFSSKSHSLMVELFVSKSAVKYVTAITSVTTIIFLMVKPPKKVNKASMEMIVVTRKPVVFSP